MDDWADASTPVLSFFPGRPYIGQGERTPRGRWYVVFNGKKAFINGAKSPVGSPPFRAENGLVKNPDKLAKNSDGLVKNPDQLAKNSDGLVKNPDQLAKNSDGLAKTQHYNDPETSGCCSFSKPCEQHGKLLRQYQGNKQALQGSGFESFNSAFESYVRFPDRSTTQNPAEEKPKKTTNAYRRDAEEKQPEKPYGISDLASGLGKIQLVRRSGVSDLVMAQTLMDSARDTKFPDPEPQEVFAIALKASRSDEGYGIEKPVPFLMKAVWDHFHVKWVHLPARNASDQVQGV